MLFILLEHTSLIICRWFLFFFNFPCAMVMGICSYGRALTHCRRTVYMETLEKKRIHIQRATTCLATYPSCKTRMPYCTQPWQRSRQISLRDDSHLIWKTKFPPNCLSITALDWFAYDAKSPEKAPRWIPENPIAFSVRVVHIIIVRQ